MKQGVRRRLRQLCAPLTAEPHQFADELIVLIEGAYAATHTFGGKNSPPVSCPAPPARS